MPIIPEIIRFERSSAHKICSLQVVIPVIILLLPLNEILASDGVLEINAVCAAQGCFTGDLPGYPVNVTGADGSSYILTSDLTLPDENTTGIVIRTSHITIDLGGHHIDGPVVCEGASTVCNLTGTGDGIRIDGGSIVGVEVKNGVVSGAGRDGINLGDQSIVRNMRVMSNARVGIDLGTAAIVEGVTSSFNADDGIAVASNSVVRNSTSQSNAGNGISASGGTVVSVCTLADNETNGVFGLSGTLVSDSTFIANGGDALELNNNSGYRGNVFAGNANNISGGVNLGGNLCDLVVCP